ncbi:Actin-related protein 6 [Savitreella phatthalungensis]
MTGNAVLVLDNGADSIKAWLGGAGASGHGIDTASGEAAYPVNVYTNAAARSKDDRRVLIGPEIDAAEKSTLLGTLQYRRPFEKGHLVSWEAERAIWWEVLQSIDVRDPTTTTLVLGTPLKELSNLQANTDEVVFEEFNFDRFYRAPSMALCAWGPLGERFGEDAGDGCVVGTDGRATLVPAEACVVLDIGYTATLCTPVVEGVAYITHARTLPVGGRFLTNWLKEQISFRQYNLMEEFTLVDRCKRAACFVTDEFNKCMDLARVRDPSIVANYALPDFARNLPDRLLSQSDIANMRTKPAADEDDLQYLTLTNETFRTPEILFNPSDIPGLRVGGLAQLVREVIDCVDDESTRAVLWENVIVVGGSSQFRGLRSRLETELRALAPDVYTVRVLQPDNPTTYACASAAAMATHAPDYLAAQQVSRAEWFESGRKITAAKFDAARARAVPGVRGGERSSAFDGTPALDMRGSGINTPDPDAIDGVGTGGAELPSRTEGKRSMYVEEDVPDTPRSFSPDATPEPEESTTPASKRRGSSKRKPARQQSRRRKSQPKAEPEDRDQGEIEDGMDKTDQ